MKKRQCGWCFCNKQWKNLHSLLVITSLSNIYSSQERNWNAKVNTVNLQLPKWSIKCILFNWTKCLPQLWEVQQVAQRSEVLQGAWAAGSTVRASEALPTRAHVLFQDKQLRHIPSNWSWSQAIPTQRWEWDCSKYNTYLICGCFEKQIKKYES